MSSVRLQPTLTIMNEAENSPSTRMENSEHFEHDPTSAAVNAGAVPQTLYALIEQQPFLKGLSPRQLERLTEDAIQMQFEAGQHIFREGELANRFYLILEGSVALESEGADGTTIPIQTLGPGDDLGWSWLFLPYYLHFSARAIQPTRVLFFYGTRLRQKCEMDHDLGYELMKRVGQVLVQRLEATRRKLLETPGEK